ncbi:TPA: hypothetical protein DEP21_01165 [Patescibacteria group bacterium]|nr:hypothetical protein [Candidatus Gracilibacteria bacterium]
MNVHEAAATLVPRFEKITSYQWMLIVIIIILLVQEFIIKVIKKNLRHKYLIDNPHGPRGKNDNYLTYYKKSQAITLFRVIVIIIAIIILLSE